MSVRKRIYVSMNALQRGTIIRRADAPKVQSDLPVGGIYCVGPFRTVHGARVCASGEHAPGVQSVGEFERVARLRKEVGS